MKKVHFTEVPAENVERGDACGVAVRWVITGKDGAPNFSMRVFDIEPDGYTPSHQHDWEHEVFILEGTGVFVQGENEYPLKPGDVVFVAPNEQHQFRSNPGTRLRLICLIPHKGM